MAQVAMMEIKVSSGAINRHYIMLRPVILVVVNPLIELLLQKKNNSRRCNGEMSDENNCFFSALIIIGHCF